MRKYRICPESQLTKWYEIAPNVLAEELNFLDYTLVALYRVICRGASKPGVAWYCRGNGQTSQLS